MNKINEIKRLRFTAEEQINKILLNLKIKVENEGVKVDNVEIENTPRLCVEKKTLEYEPLCKIRLIIK